MSGSRKVADLTMVDDNTHCFDCEQNEDMLDISLEYEIQVRTRRRLILTIDDIKLTHTFHSHCVFALRLATSPPLALLVCLQKEIHFFPEYKAYSTPCLIYRRVQKLFIRFQKG